VAMITVIAQDNMKLILKSLYMTLSTKCRAAELKASRSNALPHPLPSVTFPTLRPSIFQIIPGKHMLQYSTIKCIIYHKMYFRMEYNVHAFDTVLIFTANTYYDGRSRLPRA